MPNAHPVTDRGLTPDDREFKRVLADAAAAGLTEVTVNGSVLVYCPERGCGRFRSRAHRHARSPYAGVRRMMSNAITGGMIDVPLDDEPDPRREGLKPL